MSVANSRWEASATNRVDSARELGKHAISCFFDDATAMGRDQRLEDLRPASHCCSVHGIPLAPPASGGVQAPALAGMRRVNRPSLQILFANPIYAESSYCSRWLGQDLRSSGFTGLALHRQGDWHQPLATM
jgi:hypothetical protein